LCGRGGDGALHHELDQLDVNIIAFATTSEASMAKKKKVRLGELYS
jgi:hypothetical protein